MGTAAEKAQTLTGESEAKEFAKTIQEHLNEDNKLEVRVEKNDSTTVANLNAGYYLIKDKEGSQTQTPPNSAYTSYILKVVGNTTAKTKLDVPELVKKVQENSKKDIEGNGWQDAADYNIDEVIPYKLTGTLPSNYAEYETYFYEFNDIMSAGLTFDKMSVKVTVDGTTLTADQDYSLMPVYHGTDEGVLQIAAGHLPGSSLPVGGENTHSLISGHRGLPSAKLFTDIDKLKKGDLFFIHVFDEVLAYKVNQIKIVLPDDVETLEIEKGKDYVTLITCTPYGVNSHRLLVRGERTVYKQSESKIEDMIKKNNLKYIMLTAGVILALIGMTVLVSVFLIKRRKRRKLNEK